ncbi:MAG: FeoB-associated Cys-rich membrane protein [Ruminococcaceae bacterium]|nr:FeoB-associated Cys-rich membrane protein [Oscillospiraceae bacterium]
MGTLFVGLILLAIIISISCSLLHDRKQGKHSCGGSCGSCAGCAHCCGERK